MQDIINSPWFIFSGWVGTIIGIIVSIYYANKSKTRKSIIYEIETVSVVTEKAKDIGSLCVSWEDNRIQNLFVSDLTLWNDGNKTVLPSDFPKLDPLRLFADENCEVYATNITSSTNPAGNFNLKYDTKNTIIINFDLIRPGEGVKIKIYHSSNEKKYLTIEGQIIDFEKPLNKQELKTVGYEIRLLLASISSLILLVGSLFFALRKPLDFYSFIPEILIRLFPYMVGLSCVVGVLEFTSEYFRRKEEDKKELSKEIFKF